MQPLDTTAGTFANAIFLPAEDNRRLIILVHEPRSHNADDTGIPFFPSHYNSGQIIHIHTGQFRFGLGQNILFNGLPLAVEHIQFHSQGFRFRIILGQQQFHALAGRTDTPGRIQPGRQPKAHMTGI